MGYVYCECGNRISDVCTSDCNLSLINDKDLEELEGEKDIYPKLLDKCISVWECDKCGRIAVGNNNLKWYAPCGYLIVDI